MNPVPPVDVDVSSETTVQVRSDMAGTLFAAGRETAWTSVGLGTTRFEAGGELGFGAGFDEALDGELFVLAVDGQGGPLRWTLGRQRVELPTYGRLLDGGRLQFTPGGGASVEAWAGLVRHVGLDGILAGAPAARLGAGLSRGSFSGVVGAWGEFGATTTLHPDLHLRFKDPDAALAPDVAALGALGLDGDATVVERARVEVGLRPLAGVNTRAHLEHRSPLVEGSGLGADILATFAPLGTDEAGVGLGWTDTRRSRLWVEGALQAWARGADGEDDGLGLRAQASWTPTCGTEAWCVTPTWRGASGPGGVYQALGAWVEVPTPSPLDLGVQGMVVPYHKPHLPWDTALVVGARVGVHPTSLPLRVELGGELARSAIAPVDPRGWATLFLETR